MRFLAVEESDDEYRVVIAIVQGSNMELDTELADNILSIAATVSNQQSSSVSVSCLSRSIMLDKPVDATCMRTEMDVDAIVIRSPRIG